jgi:hypothetical protein
MDAADHPESNPLTALRGDLLRGQVDHLEAHLAALSALETHLLDSPWQASDLAALRAEADRNRDILGAAAAGVRAALRRLGEAGAPAAVYAPDGRRVALGSPSPGRERKA